MVVERPPRLVLYGIGQYGSRVARIAVQKSWPIVAAVNRSGPKVGQDLGRVAGLETDLGVIIQDCDVAEFEAMDADVGIVTMTDRLALNFDAYERLLSAGMNVICLATQASYPQAADPKLAERIEAMAVANGVTFTGTSLWDMTRIWAGIMAASSTTELRKMSLTSVTNVGRAGVHALQYVGVGQTQEEFAANLAAGAGLPGGAYSLVPQQVLRHLGYSVTEVNEHNEPVIFDVAVDCAALEQTIDAGVCAGTRIVSEVSTAEGVTVDMHVELRLLLEGEREHTEWKVVDGRPPCSITVDRRDSVHHSAATIINRVPDVIAAAPGIQLVSELGPQRSTAILDHRS